MKGYTMLHVRKDVCIQIYTSKAQLEQRHALRKTDLTMSHFLALILNHTEINSIQREEILRGYEAAIDPFAMFVPNKLRARRRQDMFEIGAQMEEIE